VEHFVGGVVLRLFVIVFILFLAGYEFCLPCFWLFVFATAFGGRSFLPPFLFPLCGKLFLYSILAG
jgi:hypothetical protein